MTYVIMEGNQKKLKKWQPIFLMNLTVWNLSLAEINVSSIIYMISAPVRFIQKKELLRSAHSLEQIQLQVPLPCYSVILLFADIAKVLQLLSCKLAVTSDQLYCRLTGWIGKPFSRLYHLYDVTYKQCVHSYNVYIVIIHSLRCNK